MSSTYIINKDLITDEIKDVLDEIIENSEFLTRLIEDEDDDIDYDFIKGQIQNFDLVLRLYTGDFEFNNKELIMLSETFRFLISESITEVLILMKLKNNDNFFTSIFTFNFCLL